MYLLVVQIYCESYLYELRNPVSIHLVLHQARFDLLVHVFSCFSRPCDLRLPSHAWCMQDIASRNSPKVLIEKQIDSQLSLSRCSSATLFAGIVFRDVRVFQALALSISNIKSFKNPFISAISNCGGCSFGSSSDDEVTGGMFQDPVFTAFFSYKMDPSAL